MNPRINQLAQSLLRKDSLEVCSLEEVREFADRHPYFGAAQLLLTKKMQLEQCDGYDDQLQKTFLYFHNPLWVEQLLNEGGGASLIAAPESKEEVRVEVKEESVPVPQEAREDTAEVTNIVEPQPQPLFQPPSQPEAALAFEPFHTVDYFASQGIKLREEEKTNTRFGKQLMSFTEWLKTMKRLPANEIAKEVGPSAEHQVEELAVHSIEGKEVYTEAMAEVWEKQGNTAKAIDIYRKLSLLEPSKSPYFAAKIEALKK